MPYKKRLREHLRETKAHARGLERRIKALGGKAEAGNVVAEAGTRLTEVASRAVAAAQGPLHALRGTGEQEKMLKNAKSEYAEEHEEIATYAAIEALAETVGDADTAKLARRIRREEEKMARYLERLIPTLAKAVSREEIPAAERQTSARRRSTSGGRSRSAASTRSRSTASTAGRRARR